MLAAAVCLIGCRTPQSASRRTAFADLEVLVRLHPAYPVCAQTTPAKPLARAPLPDAAVPLAPPEAPRVREPVPSPLQIRPGADQGALTVNERAGRGDLDRRLQARRRELGRATEQFIASETVRLDEQRLAARRAILEKRAARLRDIQIALALLSARLDSPGLAGGERAAIEKRMEPLRAEGQSLLAEEAKELAQVQRRFEDELRAVQSRRAAQDEEALSSLRASLAKKAVEVVSIPARERPPARPVLPPALSAPASSAQPPRIPAGSAPPIISSSAQYFTQTMRDETAALAVLLARRHNLRLEFDSDKRGRLPDATRRAARWLADYWSNAN